MSRGESPANPFALALNAQRELLDNVVEGFEKAEVVDERIDDIASVEVGQTPSEVVYEENKLELLHYEPLTETQHDVPIIVVYALINKPFILDLQPDRSVIRRLLEAGHDVYLIDWNEPSRLDQYLTLDDYVNRYVDNCVDVVRERSGQDSINVLGYCMGGTMTAMYAALHQEKVRTLGLMAAGLCFDDTGGILELWGDEEYYDPEDVTETYGNMPAEMLDVGFALMDPVANYVSKYVRLYDNLENEEFVKNFARMERWLSEGIDVAGETYVEFLEDIYQDNKLYNNELELGGEHVDVTSIEVPILQITGEYDHLIPTSASKPFNEVVGSDDVTTIEYPTGHIGLAVSGSSHSDVWPQVAEWYLEKSAEDTFADVLGEGVEEALGVDVDTDVTEGDVGEVEVVVTDGDEEIARDVIARDADAIEEFLEEALDVDIELRQDDDEIVVEVTRGEEVSTTAVSDTGAAIGEEVAEAAREEAGDGEAGDGEAEASAEAATEAPDVEAIDGIGPTYGERLRAAGVTTTAELAEAEVPEVAEVAEVAEDRARDWIERARESSREQASE